MFTFHNITKVFCMAVTVQKAVKRLYKKLLNCLLKWATKMWLNWLVKGMSGIMVALKHSFGALQKQDQLEIGLQ